MVEYRKYEKTDSEAIIKLEKNDIMAKNMLAVSVDALNKSYDDKYIKSFVAVENSEIIGFIYGYYLPNGLLIPEYLYVCPNYRHNSIGEKLLDVLSMDTGCDTIQVYYHKSLRGFYEKCGYTFGDNLEVAIKDISK